MRDHLSAPSKRAVTTLFALLIISLIWRPDAVRGRSAGLPAGPPRLLSSTLLGGQGEECVEAMAIDSAGNIYLAGWTTSADLPVTANAVQSRLSGNRDGFIIKLNPGGRAILYGSYIGGSLDDTAQSVAVDASGNIYIGGWTASPNFPVLNPLQSSHGGGVTDGFVLKLSADGATTLYSTYLGGNGDDDLQKLLVDGSGSVYLAGSTAARNFPTSSAFSPVYRGGTSDGFVTRLAPTGTSIIYSTFIGGSQSDSIGSIALDNSGNIYATGTTNSSDFPVISAFQSSAQGDFDCFVTKLSATGQSLIFSTFLGGSNFDVGTDIAINPLGQAYITGITGSRNFPIQIPPQPKFGGGNYDAFVTRLREDGRLLLYSTFLGGNGSSTQGDDEAYGITLAPDGHAYITGATFSPAFPTTASIKSQHRDAFIVKLGLFGTPLVYSTYLGGDGPEIARDIVLDGQLNAYVAGTTNSSDFPVMQAIQSSRVGPSDAFLTRIESTQRGGVSLVSAASYAATPMAPDSIVAAFATGLSDLTQISTTTPLPTELGGARVVMNDIPVPFFFVSPNQINFLFPSGLTSDPRAFYVYNDGAIVGFGEVEVAPVAPGIFSVDGTGSGYPAAFILRVRSDGSVSYENVSFRQPVTGNDIGLPISLDSATDQVFLVLFATGVRYRSALSNVSANVGGLASQVVYCGPQNQFLGLDQINIRLAPSLRGRGEVPVSVNVDGRNSNAVKVLIL